LDTGIGRTAALTTDEVNDAPTTAHQQNEKKWLIVGILFITITIILIIAIMLIL